MELFGLRLRTLRIEKHLTQKQLADKIGVGKATISGYEKCSGYPSVTVLIQLCRYFNVSADFLLGLSDNNEIIMSSLTDNQYTYIMGIVMDLEQYNKSRPGIIS